MDWSCSSACRLCHGILTEIGRALPCLSAPEHRRQSSFGRKHYFLRIVSVHVCEPHLGSDSCFRHRHEKASFLSLVTDSTPRIFAYAQGQSQRGSRSGAKITKGKVWPDYQEYFGGARARGGVAGPVKAASV